MLFLNPDASIDERSLGALRVSSTATQRSARLHRGSSTRTEPWRGLNAAFRGSGRRTPGRCSCTGSSLGRTGRTMWFATPACTANRVPGVGIRSVHARSTRAARAAWGLGRDFFLYGEDIDLCKRIRELGYDIRFEPRAIVVHSEGASAPYAATLPLLAASRLLYARKHASRLTAFLERVGVGIEELTRVALSRGGLTARRGTLERCYASSRAVRRRQGTCPVDSY